MRPPPQYPTIREQALAGSLIPFAFLSDIVDGFTEADYAFPGWPSLPGFKAVELQVRGIWTHLQAGTITTVATISVGNDTDAANMIAATDALPTDKTGADAIKTPGGGPFLGAQSTAQVLSKLPDLATPPRVRVVTAATGNGAFTRCLFRLLAQGCVAKLPTIDNG
jgi:hypothetical protein